jgi:hypothetical protein
MTFLGDVFAGGGALELVLKKRKIKHLQTSA